MLRLEHNDNLGRVIRIDDISTIGVSTYTMLEEAIRGGREQEALALADYYLSELRIMHNILMTWAQDIIRFMIRRDTGAENPLAQTLSGVICKAWWDFEFGSGPLNKLKKAIDTSETERAMVALEHLWLEFKIPHDVWWHGSTNCLTTWRSKPSAMCWNRSSKRTRAFGGIVTSPGIR